MRIGVLRPRTAAIYSVDSFSDVVVGRENQDQPLDGGGNYYDFLLSPSLIGIGNLQYIFGLDIG